MTAKARKAALRNLRKARAARGGRKRRTRRVKLANRAPRRRRYRMARRRKSGGRRKGTVLTPKNLIVMAPVALGAIAAGKSMLMQYKTDGDVIHATTGIVAKGGSVAFDKTGALTTYVPLVGGIVGSKVLKIVLAKTGQAAPVVSRVLNIKLARV